MAFDELGAAASGLGSPGMEAEGSDLGCAGALASARPVAFGVAGLDFPGLDVPELEDAGLEDAALDVPELEDAGLDDVGLDAAGLDDVALGAAATDAAWLDDPPLDEAAVGAAEPAEASPDVPEPAGTPGMAAATDEAAAEAEPASAEPAACEPG